MCSQGCFVRTDSLGCNSFLWLSVLQVPNCVSFRRGILGMAEWADSTSRSMAWTERRPARFFKEAAGPESSGDEFRILEDDRCIDTGVFQQHYLLHELVHTILTHADWCAVWTAAQCEVGLLQVVGTMGACVIWFSPAQTFTVICPALFLSRLSVPTHTRRTAAAHDKRTDEWHRRDIFNVAPTDMLRKSALRSRGKTLACGQSHQKKSQKVKTKRQRLRQS